MACLDEGVNSCIYGIDSQLSYIGGNKMFEKVENIFCFSVVVLNVAAKLSLQNGVTVRPSPLIGRPSGNGVIVKCEVIFALLNYIHCGYNF